MDKKPSSRLTQYLDFVKLYTDVHKESNAKKEANIIWKQKIQSTSNDELSTMDYLEQLALLKDMQLDYQGDLSGGGFLLRGGDEIRSCACGSAFTRLES